jgi:hypothetical protein
MDSPLKKKFAMIRIVFDHVFDVWSKNYRDFSLSEIDDWDFCDEKGVGFSFNTVGDLLPVLKPGVRQQKQSVRTTNISFVLQRGILIFK